MSAPLWLAVALLAIAFGIWEHVCASIARDDAEWLRKQLQHANADAQWWREEATRRGPVPAPPGRPLYTETPR